MSTSSISRVRPIGVLLYFMLEEKKKGKRREEEKYVEMVLINSRKVMINAN